MKKIRKPRNKYRLTEQEINLLSLLASGKKWKDVPSTMFFSRSTVKRYMNNIFEKLNAQSKPHAVAIAIRKGIIE